MWGKSTYAASEVGVPSFVLVVLNTLQVAEKGPRGELIFRRLADADDQGLVLEILPEIVHFRK